MKLKNLAAQRLRKGFTQIKLAEKAGIAPATLRRYEKKDAEVYLDRATKLAEALGCTLKDLEGKQ